MGCNRSNIKIFPSEDKWGWRYQVGQPVVGAGDVRNDGFFVEGRIAKQTFENGVVVSRAGNLNEVLEPDDRELLVGVQLRFDEGLREAGQLFAWGNRLQVCKKNKAGATTEVRMNKYTNVAPQNSPQLKNRAKSGPGSPPQA